MNSLRSYTASLQAYFLPWVKTLHVSWLPDHCQIVRTESWLSRQHTIEQLSLPTNQLSIWLETNDNAQKFDIQVGLQFPQVESYLVCISSGLEEPELRQAIQEMTSQSVGQSADLKEYHLKYTRIERSDFEDMYRVDLIPNCVFNQVSQSFGEWFKQVIFIGHPLQINPTNIRETQFQLLVSDEQTFRIYRYHQDYLINEYVISFEENEEIGTEQFATSNELPTFWLHTGADPVPEGVQAIDNPWQHDFRFWLTSALRETAKHPKHITNHTPDQIRSKSLRSARVGYWQQVTRLILLIELVLMLFAGIARGFVGFSSISMETQLADNSIKFRSTQTLVDQRKAALNDLKDLNVFNWRRSCAAFLLYQLESCFTETIVLTKLQLHRQSESGQYSLEINGQVTDDARLYEMISILETLPEIISVKLHSAQRKQTEFTQFILTAVLI